MRVLLFLALAASLICIAFRPARTAEGIVLDPNGKGVRGAAVRIKGGAAATLTDDSGRFSLAVPGERAQLEIAAVGYVTAAAEYKGTRMLIVLQPANADLQEVVVVGYATHRRRDLAGAVPGQAAGIRIRREEEVNTEEYGSVRENIFHSPRMQPRSTFSVDVDRASYSNMRRFLNNGQLPPAGAVRVEEMINYFRYSAPQPTDGRPFAVQTELGACPWNNEHRLARITLQGRDIPLEALPPAHLVFLVDVSGSMNQPEKLPLVKESLRILTERMRPQDKVSIVVYAGSGGLVLPPTSGAEKETIIAALNRLEAGGSTAGGAGIRLAYSIARQNFIKGGNNRVVLCTDGDFNVGVSSEAELKQLIEKERESGVYLTALGYGMGNYKDNKMQELAQNGNGNNAYIDNVAEARKVLGTAFGGTLFTIARDVKLQVEFNPAVVGGYRLVGYESRMLQDEDFDDDAKDAGEMGSGHTVTALYEIIPAGTASPFLKGSRDLKYQQRAAARGNGDEVLTVHVRYKGMGASRSEAAEYVLANRLPEDQSPDFHMAAAVAEFGLLLTGSPFRSNASYDRIIALGRDWNGTRDEEREEFFRLVEKAKLLATSR